MKSLKAMYEGTRPIGGIQLTNMIGLEVYAAKEDDSIAADMEAEYVTVWHNGTEKQNYRRNKVRYDIKNGRPYITRGKNRFYLDEIVRQ